MPGRTSCARRPGPTSTCGHCGTSYGAFPGAVSSSARTARLSDAKPADVLAMLAVIDAEMMKVQDRIAAAHDEPDPLEGFRDVPARRRVGCRSRRAAQAARAEAHERRRDLADRDTRQLNVRPDQGQNPLAARGGLPAAAHRLGRSGDQPESRGTARRGDPPAEAVLPPRPPARSPAGDLVGPRPSAIPARPVSISAASACASVTQPQRLRGASQTRRVCARTARLAGASLRRPGGPDRRPGSGPGAAPRRRRRRTAPDRRRAAA